MSTAVNEDGEQRTTSSMEESNAMTIEYLRARLLAERSVSKTARQRADELAKRVAELEEQLNFISLQRKKAEKATVDVLAILENRGISDLSEEFSSCSEEDENPCNYKETSTNMKPRKNETEAYSSSEIESSPSTGRSLSWRSSKDSQHSSGKNKYLDSIRRRASFASSNSSSARRVGKSCRRIRRRETRPMEELQNDHTEKARDVSNCSDGEPVALRESSGHDNGKSPIDGPTSESNTETRKVNGHYFDGRERDKEDMESALQHQAQLIGRYEEEEKAQREWEDKYRENNSGTQDAYDLGNHSDVTEERYDTKSPELPSASGTSNSNNQETKQELFNPCSIQEPQTSNSLPAKTRTFQDEKSNTATTCESEFSFPTSKDRNIQDSQNVSQQISHAAANNPLSLELAIVPLEASSNYSSVLEALQRAKSSLREKLHSSVSVQRETGNLDNFRIPTVSPAIFRLPTDEQLEAIHRANSVTGAGPSFATYHSEFANGKFFYANALSGNVFSSVPYRPFTTSEIQPRLSEGPPSYSRPSAADSYPYLSDITPRLPTSEGSLRSFSSSESGMPPVVRLSSYEEQRVRPNMLR